MYALVDVFFVLGVEFWLTHTGLVKQKASKRFRWLLLIIGIVQISAELISHSLHSRFGNLILHSIGGGVVVSLMFFYLQRQYAPKMRLDVQIVAVLLLASGLGCLNEMAEYAMELIGYAIFSLDTHDTWRDISANTVGAFVGWVLFTAYLLVHKKLRNPTKDS